MTTTAAAAAAGPIHRLARYAGGRLELWLTPCIVTMPPPNSHCLVVPSNERLVGTQFSHFPVGGPTPCAPIIGLPPPNKSSGSQRNDYHDGTPSSDTILYACETVDGTVTEYAGVEFERQVQKLPLVEELSQGEDYPIRCPTGQARRIPSVGYLQQNFESLILTVAPFYNNHDLPQTTNNQTITTPSSWQRDLTSAYTNAFGVAHGIVATPLLGAGARGAPVEEAARVAAASILSFLASCSLEDQDHHHRHDHGNNDRQNNLIKDNGFSDINNSNLDIIRLCVLEEDVAEILHDNLQNELC